MKQFWKQVGANMEIEQVDLATIPPLAFMRQFQLTPWRIVDFPDPNSFALGKLYTTRFYRLLRNHLTPDAAVAVQCTSPLFARRSYWCIIRTIEAAGFVVRPYQATVPSFGVWGFALARQQPFAIPARVSLPLRFLDEKTLATMFVLPPDMGPVPVEINRLDNQMLVRYYEEEWKKWS